MKPPRLFRPSSWELLEDRIVPSTAASTTVPILPPSNVPTERLDAYSLARHAADAEVAESGTASVVMLGDSITDFWDKPSRDDPGASSWQTLLAPLGAVNFGVSGDRTDNLIWRVENGELAGKPKVAVVEIGTNNLGWGESVTETYQGIAAVLDAVHAASPGTQVVLMGVFPRGFVAGAPIDAEVAELNAMLPGLAESEGARFLDLAAELGRAGETVSPAVFPDGLHPDSTGYQTWAEALRGVLESMLAPTTTGTVTPSPPSPGAAAAFAATTPHTQPATVVGPPPAFQTTEGSPPAPETTAQAVASQPATPVGRSVVAQADAPGASAGSGINFSGRR